MRQLLWLSAALLLAACGPAGVLSGKVQVEGGSAAGVAVIIYGPQSAAAVTGDDGSFSVGSLPDGRYVVRATVRGADVEEQTATTTLTQGKASPEPVLSFRASTGKVAGRVVMTDGSEAGELVVVAVGPETRTARTASDGAFSFDGLKAGGYVVTAEARDTKEGRASVGVTASGSPPAVELRFTPVGRLAGTVTFNAMPAAGVPVLVTGTSLSAVTDAQGRFALEGVPTGPQALLARVGSEPFWRSATAMVTVARGANPDQALTLADDPPKTGTVTGVVTFHGARSPRDITVSVPGTSATTQPAANGAFSLTVPVGVWDVVASAPLHPQKVLGRVTVADGQSRALVGQVLSWYRPIWQSITPITSFNTTYRLPSASDTLPWGVVVMNDGSNRLALVNVQTGELRLLGFNPTRITLSRNGKYLAWANSTTAFVYEIAAGTFSSYFGTLAIDVLEFSSDESALFIKRGLASATTLTRIKFTGTPASETFPATGTVPNIVEGSPDRWFVREVPSNDVRLVTPRGDVPQIFPAIGEFQATPIAWALTNCTTTCKLRVLGPNSETPPAPVPLATDPGPGSVQVFDNLSRSSRADYPCFAVGTSAFCVKTADNTLFPLPFVPSQFKLNEAGDRVIWVHPSGANQVLREEAFPPTASGTALAQNTFAPDAGFQTGWLSPTRAAAYEPPTVTPRNVYLVSNGVSATDSDVGAQDIALKESLLVYPGAGAMGRWKAVLADGMTRVTEVPSTQPIIGLSARASTIAFPARYGAVSFALGSAWIVDDMGLRLTLAGSAFGPDFIFRSNGLEWGPLIRGSDYLFFVYSTGAILEAFEGSAPISFIKTPNLAGNWGVVTVLSDGRTLALGRFQ